MSREILQRLYQAVAFKPTPPDYELAIAHVRVEEVGIPRPIDDQVLHAMTSDDEAFVIVVGPPGSGKSSILTAAALNAGSPDTPPHPMPLIVPVAHYDGTITPDLLVRAITQGLARALGGHLKPKEIKKLDRALATSIARSRQSGGLTGSISGGHPGVLTGTIGGAFGKDLVTYTTDPSWENGTPKNRLLGLRDLAAGHQARLVVIFHDTDIWSVGDDDMAARARSFFSALRVLLDCPEITFIVAVQTLWTEDPQAVTGKAAAARKEYRELAERAGVQLDVPKPLSDKQALDLVTAIINRRVENALDDLDAPKGGWAPVLFSPAALLLLAHRCRSRSVRLAITDIRNALERLEEMPDQIQREHLLDAIYD
jgi:hypothetical protein